MCIGCNPDYLKFALYSSTWLLLFHSQYYNTLIVHFMHTSALKCCHAKTLSNESMITGFRAHDQPGYEANSVCNRDNTACTSIWASGTQHIK